MNVRSYGGRYCHIRASFTRIKPLKVIELDDKNKKGPNPGLVLFLRDLLISALRLNLVR